jgi:N-acetylglutamate synthase-like GNAT family acetyltransferase
MGESNQFSIRTATLIDADGILNCLHSAFQEFRGSYTTAAFLDTVLTPETARERLEAMHVFIAVDEADQVIGTIACEAVGQDAGHIRGMAVLPRWQGTGAALQLLRTAESRLRQSECTRVSLDTTAPLRRAIRFYERNGFRPSGRVTDFFGMPLFEYVKTFKILAESADETRRTENRTLRDA